MDQDEKAQAGRRRQGGHRQAHDGHHHIAQQVAHDGHQTRHKGQRDEHRRVGQGHVPHRQNEQQKQGREQGVEGSNPELRRHDLPECLAKQGDALGQLLGQRPQACLGGAHSGQRANEQAHIGKQHTAQPCTPCHGQCACLGAQVVGDDALDFCGALGQMGRHVGRQLQAQFQHRAGHVGEQFAVLLRRINQVTTRMRQPGGQQRQGHEHDHGSGYHLGRPGWRISRWAVALRAGQAPRARSDPRSQRAGEQKAQAYAQQAGQQPAPHHQQECASHQQIAGQHHTRPHRPKGRWGGGVGGERRRGRLWGEGWGLVLRHARGGGAVRG